jgi:hypothetical protein
MSVTHSLIHDWNQDGASRPPGEMMPPVMLDDETLRDGLQSPSVRTPDIEAKIDLLQRMAVLGIDTANIGLPGAGPHVARDVERLARVIGEQRLSIAANCAARTVLGDIVPIAEISQRAGVAIECCAFIGSSPLRQYAEGWTLDHLQRVTEEAVGFAVREGLTVMYITEDTTRADPASLRALFTTALRAGASDTPPLEARQPSSGSSKICSASCSRAPGSIGTAIRIAVSALRARWRRLTPGPPGSTAPRWVSVNAPAIRRSICCSSTW